MQTNAKETVRFWLLCFKGLYFEDFNFHAFIVTSKFQEELVMLDYI